MANKPTHKMTNQARAKQFAPFSALKGLSEALHDKELSWEPKKELSEDAAALINQTLHTLSCGMSITVCYYDGRAYQTISGVISAFSKTKRIIEIADTKIPFAMILTIVSLSR